MASAFLSTAILVAVVSLIVVGCMEDDSMDHHLIYKQWFRHCGRWLMLLLITTRTTGIILSYVLLAMVIDITLPNPSWEDGHVPQKLATVFQPRLSDPAAFSYIVQSFIVWIFLASAGFLISIGTTTRYLMRIIVEEAVAAPTRESRPRTT
jgi:hypothetical protein